MEGDDAIPREALGLPEGFHISHYVDLLGTSSRDTDLAAKLQSTHSCQAHVGYLLTHPRVTTSRPGLQLYFLCLWVLSAVSRLREVEDPVERGRLLHSVSRAAVRRLGTKLDQHVRTMLRVSAAVACYFHDRYVAQTASEHGSFDVAGFYELAPVLINDPAFLQPLLDSLLGEKGHVGFAMIKSHGDQLLARRPVITAVSGWKIEDDGTVDGQVSYRVQLQPLEDSEAVAWVWLPWSQQTFGERNRDVIQAYKETLSKEYVRITFAPLDAVRELATERYELHRAAPIHQKRHKRTDPALKVSMGIMEDETPRLVTRQEIVRMDIPAWLVMLQACEASFKCTSKIEKGVRWALVFDPESKRRQWREMSAQQEEIVKLVLHELKGIRPLMERCMKRELTSSWKEIGGSCKAKNGGCPCGEYHTDSDDRESDSDEEYGQGADIACGDSEQDDDDGDDDDQGDALPDDEETANIIRQHLLLSLSHLETGSAVAVDVEGPRRAASPSHTATAPTADHEAPSKSCGLGDLIVDKPVSKQDVGFLGPAFPSETCSAPMKHLFDGSRGRAENVIMDDTNPVGESLHVPASLTMQQLPEASFDGSTDSSSAESPSSPSLWPQKQCGERAHTEAVSNRYCFLTPEEEAQIAILYAENRNGVELEAADAESLQIPDGAVTEEKTEDTGDAAVSGRVVVTVWADFRGEGVFAGPTGLAAGEMLGVLEGIDIPRKQRLTESERRRVIGIYVDGKGAHIDMEGRWPGKINHAPPSRCNVDWDPVTRKIFTTRAIAPGEQLFFDYGVGFWVDELMDKEYADLPKDQREFFDLMHAVVTNYTWLSESFRRSKPSQAMRMRIITFYVFEQAMKDQTVQWLPSSEGTQGAAGDSPLGVNPVVQYMQKLGLHVRAEVKEPQHQIFRITTAPAPLNLSTPTMASITNDNSSLSPLTQKQLDSELRKPPLDGSVLFMYDTPRATGVW